MYGRQFFFHLCWQNCIRWPVGEKTCLRHDGSCIGAEKETRQGQEKDVKATMILTLLFVQKVWHLVALLMDDRQLCRKLVLLIYNYIHKEFPVSRYSGCPLFFNIDFPWLFHDQKMKIHDLSAQHIFPSKRYTTYECIPELVVTVPSARSTIVKKIKTVHNLNEVVSLLQNCSVQ